MATKKKTTAPPDGRTKAGQFKKGVSGNPSGRAKTDPELKEALRAACPTAIKTLVAILTDYDSKPGDKIKASQIIIERVMGKPHQTTEDLTKPIPVDEQRELLRKAVRKLASEDPKFVKETIEAVH